MENFQSVAELYLKQFKAPEIANRLQIPVAQVRSLIKEYQTYIDNKIESDPNWLDRVGEHTLQLLEEVALLNRESWDLHERAKEFGKLADELAALKLIGDFTDKRTKLLQVVGARPDGSNIAKLQRLEAVNEIISRVIKEVVADCPHCRPVAQLELAKAFAVLDKQEAAEPELIEEPDPIIDDSEFV